MDDLISRQAAIEAVRATLLSWSYMPEWRDNKIIEAVERLPPIQPKLLQPWEVLVAQAVLPQPEIVRCKDCKYWKRSSCCEGYCGEIDMEGFDEDHYCGFAEWREVTT